MNKVDDHGNTLLMVAAQNGNLKMAKLFVYKGANPNHQVRRLCAFARVPLCAWVREIVPTQQAASEEMGSRESKPTHKRGAVSSRS